MAVHSCLESWFNSFTCLLWALRHRNSKDGCAPTHCRQDPYTPSSISPFAGTVRCSSSFESTISARYLQHRQPKSAKRTMLAQPKHSKELSATQTISCQFNTVIAKQLKVRWRLVMANHFCENEMANNHHQCNRNTPIPLRLPWNRSNCRGHSLTTSPITKRIVANGKCTLPSGVKMAPLARSPKKNPRNASTPVTSSTQLKLSTRTTPAKNYGHQERNSHCE